jgi:hypothetical protein
MVQRQITVQKINKWNNFRQRRDQAVEDFCRQRKMQFRSDFFLRYLALFKMIKAYKS